MTDISELRKMLRTGVEFVEVDPTETVHTKTYWFRSNSVKIGLSATICVGEDDEDVVFTVFKYNAEKEVIASKSSPGTKKDETAKFLHEWHSCSTSNRRGICIQLLNELGSGSRFIDADARKAKAKEDHAFAGLSIISAGGHVSAAILQMRKVVGELAKAYEEIVEDRDG